MKTEDATQKPWHGLKDQMSIVVVAMAGSLFFSCTSAPAMYFLVFGNTVSEKIKTWRFVQWSDLAFK